MCLNKGSSASDDSGHTAPAAGLASVGTAPGPPGGQLRPSYAAGLPSGEAKPGELQRTGVLPRIQRRTTATRGARGPGPEADLPWSSRHPGDSAALFGARVPQAPLTLKVSSDLAHKGQAGACRGQQSAAFSLPTKPPGSGETGLGKRPRPRLTTLGLKGGWTSLFSSFSQSILRKKVCSRTSRSPSGPQPSRLPGCLVIS